jgi:hypothetical protein
MMETDHHVASGSGHGGEHEEIHLPPNSWCPIVLAFSLTGLLLGIVVGVWLAVVGGIATVATIAVWIRNARREYLELPD